MLVSGPHNNDNLHINVCILYHYYSKRNSISTLHYLQAFRKELLSSKHSSPLQTNVVRIVLITVKQTVNISKKSMRTTDTGHFGTLAP